MSKPVWSVKKGIFISFKYKILGLFSVLIIGILGVILLVVNHMYYRRALDDIESRLEQARENFEWLLIERNKQLAASAKLLGLDFAFRQAVATGEHATILSAARNHQARIGSDLFIVTDSDGVVLADTNNWNRFGEDISAKPWIEVPLYGEAYTGLLIIDDRLYQVISFPLLAPDVIGTLSLGFRIDDNVAAGLQKITLTEISFLVGNRVIASTLKDDARQDLERQLVNRNLREHKSNSLFPLKLITAGNSEKFLSILGAIRPQSGDNLADNVDMSDTLEEPSGEPNWEHLKAQLQEAGFASSEINDLASPQSLQKGHDILLKKCIPCHSVKKILAKPRRLSEWHSVVQHMAQEAAIIQETITQQEEGLITAYLVSLTLDVQGVAGVKPMLSGFIGNDHETDEADASDLSDMLKAFSGDESEPQSTAHTDASGVSAMLSAFGDAENGIDSANDTKVSDTSEMLSAFSDVGSESQSTADAEASDTLEVLSAFDDAEGESEASDAAKGFGDSKPNQEVSETESTAVSTELVNTSEGIGASPSYLIQDSLDKALVPLKKIQRNLLLISIGAIAIGVGFSLMIAIGVTSAVHQLVRGTEEVINGNYRYQLNITQHDEIGQLADHFNTMVVGLRDKEKIRAVIDKVVSKEVAEELLKGEVKLGGETRQCTVLFSDIRGWTTISERLQPEELVEMLNAYLTLMSSAIEDQSGVIDKYIGDAVVALFGAPVSHPDAIQQSVDAAFEMRRRLAAWNVERKKNGEFPLETGIGINTGPVLAGNIGSETRLNYTVMGDTVNLAARLEGLTKLYGAGIIVSEALRNELGPEYLCRELDLIRVKGKTEAVHIFEVLAPDETGKLSQMVDRFEHALVYYRQQNWGGAEKAFIQTVGGFENDRASQLYVERIQHYRQFPPPPDWNSVFVATEKYGDDD